MKGRKSSQIFMGVDIGGTKIACALYDTQKFITPISTMKTPHGSKILSVVSNYYKRLSKKYEISGIGISTAGMVSNSGCIVGSAGNIKGWNGIRVKTLLEKKHTLKVVVENDANAAAYAEYMIGSAKGSNPLLMITLGTGVGGGIVVNGKLIRGSHFAGGEIGHIKLSYTKQRHCTCGKYDCLEAYASGNGLIELAKHYFPGKASLHSTKSLFNAAKRNNILAIRAIEDWHFFVAEGICNLVQVIDPQKVVLSGGLSSELNLRILNSDLKKLLLPAMEKPINKGLIVKSKFKNDAGLIGAALLAKQLT